MASQDRELMERWVETWKRAGPELDRIRREELASLDTREAVRQIFGSNQPAGVPSATSGLVEQQAWFSKLKK